MARSKFQIKDRVNSDFLGEGEVVKIVNGTFKGVFAYMVLFDKTPPLEYNGGNNPCLIFTSGIELIK